jgi:hypothetical protein
VHRLTPYTAAYAEIFVPVIYIPEIGFIAEDHFGGFAFLSADKVVKFCGAE